MIASPSSGDRKGEDDPGTHGKGSWEGNVDGGPKMSLSPHRKTYSSRIRNCAKTFSILIVFAVKICKPCLQTASASGATGALPLDPIAGLQFPRSLSYSPPNENSCRRQWLEYSWRKMGRQLKTELDGVDWSVAYDPLAATRHKSSKSKLNMPLKFLIRNWCNLAGICVTVITNPRGG